MSKERPEATIVVTAPRSPKAAAPVARRTGKGHVLSYGEGRVCAAPGCTALLSRYNSSAYCSALHKTTHT